MSVLFETSLGDLIVDLDIDNCPKTCTNFLKLSKTYYYNLCSFFTVQRDFIAQIGDPSDTGNGGRAFASPTFSPEWNLPKSRHTAKGTLSMVVNNGTCASQFYFTLKDKLDYLDGKHAVFGRVVGDDSLATLDKINEAFVDDKSRPLRDIRIRHVIVLDDPFPDPPDLVIPPNSPVLTAAQLKSLRIGDEEELDDPDGDQEELEIKRRAAEARAQALTLEMVGDLPFADVRPPENVLFVCKLNRVTRSEDLELIFSRFGTILSCEVIRDLKTGDSLNYAFIEFDKQEEAERAYLKMDNVLIDERRIHVDFSQSVTQLHSKWVVGRTGGRPPPSKKPRRSSSPEPRRRTNKPYDDMVFDLNGKHRDEKRRQKRDRSRSPPARSNDRRRDDYRPSDRSRNDHDRRDDRRREDSRDDYRRR